MRVAGVILTAFLTGGAVYGIASGALQGSKPGVVIPVETSSSEEAAISAENSTAEVSEATEPPHSTAPDETEGTSKTNSTEVPEEPDSSSVPEESEDTTKDAATATDHTTVPPQSEPASSSVPTSPSKTQPADSKPAETTSARPAETRPSQTVPSSTAGNDPIIHTECAHSTTESYVLPQPTCTTMGERIYFCSICGERLWGEMIPALGHSFGSWTNVIEVSCTADGKQQMVCSRCGKVEERTLTATGHSFGSWTVVTEPTCTVNGKQQRTCSLCGKVEEETVTAPGHSFSSWTTITEATCTTAGKRQYTCSRCGASEEQTVAALGHDMVDGVCTRCGESSYQFVINADGKSYTLVSVKAGLDTSKKVVLPSTYKGCPVTRIKDGLFRNYQFDGGLQLPASLNYIGESTFHSCRIAGTLTIPGSVKTIAEWAFCRANIDAIILEEGVTTLKSVSFGSMNGRPSLTVPSTVQGYDNAFSMAASGGITHFSTLTINSKSVLDAARQGGGIGSCLIDTIRIGSGVSGYTVKGNCLIHNATGTLFKAGVNFTIPTDGSVKIIDGGPFFTDFNGNVASSLYELRLPEGILRVLEAGYSSSIQTVYLPHSLQYIEPVFLGGGGLKNIIYSGTISEWNAICEKVPEERRNNWKYHSGLQLGCTDGVFYYDTDHWVQQ